jgi:hypothetical protein
LRLPFAAGSLVACKLKKKDGGRVVSPKHRPRSTRQKHYLYFIPVGSILLRNVYINISLSDIHLQLQLRVFIDVLFSYFTTCFGPTGPSSGEPQYTSYNDGFLKCCN